MVATSLSRRPNSVVNSRSASSHSCFPPPSRRPPRELADLCGKPVTVTALPSRSGGAIVNEGRAPLRSIGVHGMRRDGGLVMDDGQLSIRASSPLIGDGDFFRERYHGECLHLRKELDESRHTVQDVRSAYLQLLE